MEIIIRVGGRDYGKLTSAQEQFLAKPYEESELHSSTNLGNDVLPAARSIYEDGVKNLVSEVIKKEMRRGGCLSKFPEPPTPIHLELNTTEYVENVEKLMERDE